MNEQDLLKQQTADRAQVLGTDYGRRFYWWLLSELGLHRSVLDPVYKDLDKRVALDETHGILWRSGRQDFARQLLSQGAEANYEGFQRMHAEAHLRVLDEKLSNGGGNAVTE